MKTLGASSVLLRKPILRNLEKPSYIALTTSKINK